MGQKYIVMTGKTGVGGALKKASEAREEIAGRFPAYFLRKEEDLRLEQKNFEEGILDGISAEYRLDFNGRSILNCLWELGKELDSGMETRMELFILDQFTIEISEYFGMNPYEESAGNGALFVTETPEKLIAELEEKNLTAAVIGHLTSEVARIAYTAEGVRYLTPER